MRAETDPAPDSASDSTVESSDSPEPKPVSARKRAANRANAARSTGPRTPEGKARSSVNAVTHGLTAHADVLPGEDAEEFERFRRKMQSDLHPGNAMEEQLVERIVGLTWRLRRMGMVETALWEENNADRMRNSQISRHIRGEFGTPLMPWQSNDPPASDDGMKFMAKQFARRRVSPLERLAIYEQRLDRQLHTALRELRQLQKYRQENSEKPTEQPDIEPRAASEQNEPTPARDISPVPVVTNVILQNEPTAAAHPAFPTPPIGLAAPPACTG